MVNTSNPIYSGTPVIFIMSLLNKVIGKSFTFKSTNWSSVWIRGKRDYIHKCSFFQSDLLIIFPWGSGSRFPYRSMFIRIQWPKELKNQEVLSQLLLLQNGRQMIWPIFPLMSGCLVPLKHINKTEILLLNIMFNEALGIIHQLT